MMDQGHFPIYPAPVTQEIGSMELSTVTSKWIKQVDPHYPIFGCKDAADYFTANVFYPFTDFIQEEFIVLLLDTKHSARYEVTLYRGTLNSVLIRIAEVFREAIRLNAFAMVVAHNHPSGNATPSPEDIALTKALQEAGNLLGIQVLDHLVIGENQWTSLRQKGVFGYLTVNNFEV